MLSLFTHLADLIAYALLGLDPATRLGQAVHFFVEDVTKILVLATVMIYGIALARASLDTDRVRRALLGRSRAFGYVAGALFGAVTPFCSCSSIPLFLGFTSARIPVGVTFSFLITSPILNEVAVVLLGGVIGWKFTVAYVAIGLGAGILGGLLFDLLGAEKHLTELSSQVVRSAQQREQTSANGTATDIPVQSVAISLSWRERNEFARRETREIIGRIWKWVLIGVGIGAGLHGYVPQEWIVQHLGAGQWWSVPLAVLLGIPLYANATGVIPVIETLLAKGLPVGTALAFMLATVGASLPEFVMLKQVIRPRLLVWLFAYFLVAFTLVGWTMNALFA